MANSYESQEGAGHPYVYIQSESAAETGGYPIYTVGFYGPNGGWIPESDHGGATGRDDAAKRVAWLNGSNHTFDVPRFLRKQAT